MSSEIAQLKEDREQYQEQLDLVAGSLLDDPGNAELVALKEELQSALDIIDESLEALKEAERQAPPPAAAASQKQWQSSKHKDIENRAPDDSETPKPKVYKVNESILARWVTGDKAYYPARIMSITGSSTAPMYTVKFKSYDTIETLRARDIRPVASSAPASSGATKRKAEDSPSTVAPAKSTTPAPPSEKPPAASQQQQQQSVPPPPPANTSAAPPTIPAPPAPQIPPAPVAAYAPPAAVQAPPPPPPPPVVRPFGTRTIDRFQAGVVSSAAAQIYQQPPTQPQSQQPQSGGFGKFGAASSASSSGGAPPAVLGEEPPVKKFKKIKATKQLEAGKSKWQEFSSKGKVSKGVKKDSMFRTPEGAQGRVGFIGSGQAMRKDATRSRHIYQTNDDLD